MIEVKVPEFGESIQEVQISQWIKKVGEYVGKDEDLVELESEKASQNPFLHFVDGLIGKGDGQYFLISPARGKYDFQILLGKGIGLTRPRGCVINLKRSIQGFLVAK